ncbi:hypothetical protein NEOLEDRAFT_1122781 [Neolentinus lepideus HHB14362 ss-1]|uniref:Golgi-body localization protein domain-containing protein n=1 Tax=Neolentinus lepideus HHB14362 ss-1 TaxID=1314782 RepID=A0A165P181_9AGAM|nr:hypothetical protein NEOLEDRAFT_1122781 [Neolentinus lepideus HHB14362 ss-1]
MQHEYHRNGGLNYTMAISRALLLDSSGLSFWSYALVWLVRIITLGLLLRTYIVPTVVRLCSRRVRVRSLSLLSIRGLYINSGSKKLHIERIRWSYHRPSLETAGRIAIRIEGVKVDIERSKPDKMNFWAPRTTLRISDLAPFPVARRVWSIILQIIGYLDPIVRPVARVAFVMAMRLVIRIVPPLTHVVEFEFDSAVVTFTALSGISVVLKDATLHTTISFTQLEQVIWTERRQPTTRRRRHTRIMSVIDWKDKFASSLGRTWDRAWGRTQGDATVSLKINRIACFTRPWPTGMLHSLTDMDGLPKGCFLNLPGTIELSGSVHFNPRKTAIESRGIRLSLSLLSLFAGINDLQVLMEKVKENSHRREENSRAEEPDSFLSSQSSTHSSPTAVSPNTPSSRNPWRHSLLSPSLLRRAPRINTIQRLKHSKQLTWISTVKCINVHVSSITLQHRVLEKSGATALTYRTVISNLSTGLCLSNPAENQLHQKWLGRGSWTKSHLDAPVYASHFSVTNVRVERLTEKAFLDTFRLISLDGVDLQVLTTCWPSPLTANTSYMTEDPNEALLAIHLKLGDLQAQDRLDMLQSIITDRVPSAHRREPSLRMSVDAGPVPKVLLDVETGSLRARLMCTDLSECSTTAVIEAQSDGLIASVHSEFGTLPDKLDLQYNEHTTDRIFARMNATHSALLKPTFIRLLTAPTFADAHSGVNSDIQSSSSLPIVSLETLELHGSTSSLGYVTTGRASAVHLDLSSAVTEAHIATDALSIELWQQDVVSVLARVAASMTGGAMVISQEKPSAPPARPLVGLVFHFALDRAVVLLAGADINPSEELGLSRGVVLRAGCGVQYCSLQTQHLWRFKELLGHTQARDQLDLADTLVPNAVAVTKSSESTGKPFVFIRITCWDVAARDAVATHFESDDDPFSTAPEETFSDAREFLRIPRLQTDMVMHGSSLAESQNPEQKPTEVVTFVPEIRCNFHLAHSYCLLLGTQTALCLLKPLSRKKAPQHDAPPGLKAIFNIGTIQALCDLPIKKRVCVRVDGIVVRSTASTKIERCLLWVLNADAPRARDTQGSWEELARVRQLSLAIQPTATMSSVISVDGESARLRIPCGFIFAELVEDISTSIKAIRHLYRITSIGKYMPMAWPLAERAKSVPELRLRIKIFTFDAMDDPFESKLGLITLAGFVSAKVRDHREAAFSLKATTIHAAESSNASAISDIDAGLRFTSKHSVSIEEAYRRLLEVHSVDYIQRFQQFKETQSDREYRSTQTLEEGTLDEDFSIVPNLVEVKVHEHVPRLFDVTLSDVSLHISKPTFPPEALPDFLHSQGSGLPRDTEFTLLVPLHINLSLASLRVALRDYPLPLLNIPKDEGRDAAVFAFQTDLVIAEEIGTPRSVDWFECGVLRAHYGTVGASSFVLCVPKTIMPVKTYANPVVRVTTDGVTDFTWGVSYQAATQDIMRVIDNLTSAPRDSSPAIGFWDKMRLVFHWQVRVMFDNEVHLHMKGSRDPYEVSGHGAGFALCWQGKPRLDIGLSNEDNELVQMTSDIMLVVIPNLETEQDAEFSGSKLDTALDPPLVCCSDSKKPRKVCARFGSGVRFGVGFRLERSCGRECPRCDGTPFKRECRLFTFKPHFEVELEKKPKVPELKSPDDSYNGFRSDFIHMSISLTSALADSASRRRAHTPYSSLHLTPKTFTHFWSWWGLFDSSLSLPIRQGRLYQHSRPQSPKFGRHLATIKYRISVERVFISHVYMDESNESWTDGVTSFVGMKALIKHLHADMHQREQEMLLRTIGSDTPKVTRRKPFYAAEVVMKDLDLRAIFATFKEPLKQSVPMEKSHNGSKFQVHDKTMPDTPSAWTDDNDYVETDWISSGTPTVHLFPTASCPRFTYFKSASKATHPSYASRSKFGYEDTHTCFLGKESSVSHIQVDLARKRIRELQEQVTRAASRRQLQADDDLNSSDNVEGAQKMIALLEAYVAQLLSVDVETRRPSLEREQSYYMPLDSVSSADWAEFDNVYQVHCPKIFMSNSTRDILLQYYYCSRSRRGFEYHLATRAVKFMREQAQAGLRVSHEETSESKSKGPGASAQAAAQAFLRRLAGDDDDRTSIQMSRQPLPQPGVVDPLGGYSDGVSLRKSHFCLLLKPQIVLRSEASTNSVCVLAAVQAKLQSFAIMDDANSEDPVSGKILTRSYTSLTGLQAFSPTSSLLIQDGCVPLEVFIDLRCESTDFDRLVPQTDATFHYDKFNRLRLRSHVSSHITSAEDSDSHLHQQTDLIQVHVPQFTVSADDQHFQALSTIVTDLILFTDATHKTRLDKLETLLFRYDFTDLGQAADVVSNLQSRLRQVMETERAVEPRLRQLGTEGRIEMLKIKAHILLLAEELNLIFDAIKLAQDKYEGHSDEKSALLLRTISSEISWRMLDERRELLAKLSLRKIDYTWLSRQDSSTENNLTVGDLQAFDGSSTAVWAEIISKHNDPSNHPLVKRGLFLLAHWVVLAPVGGITVFQDFELRFHPMRLQIDTRVGRRIMEYVWPGRKNRRKELEDAAVDEPESMTSAEAEAAPTVLVKKGRTSLDSARPLQTVHPSLDMNRLAPPPLRRLGASRSFTDLRSAASTGSQVSRIQRTNSHAHLSETSADSHPLGRRTSTRSNTTTQRNASEEGDAALMKTRSSQKTFIRVRVDSLHLLLSVMKQDSFLCRGAHIKTRELLYRNQTWSFEDLVDQFIPSDPSWKGWVKMALQQPLVPVLPVARELFSKTQWIASKGKLYLDTQLEGSRPKKLIKSKPVGIPDKRLNQTQRFRTSSSARRIRRHSFHEEINPSGSTFDAGTPAETPPPEQHPSLPMSVSVSDAGPHSRARMIGLFKRGSSRPRTSADSSSSDVSLAGRRRRQSLDHV